MGDIIRGSTPFEVISDDAILIKPNEGEREGKGEEKADSDKTTRCKEICDVLTLKPLRDAMKGSNIAWVTLTLTLICTFGVVLYLSEEGKDNSLVASLLLIALMVIGVVGQLICLYKKDDIDFVQFTPLAAGHCNMYLMAGVYLFGTGTLLTIILRLLIYYHAHEHIYPCSSNINATLLMKPAHGAAATNTTIHYEQEQTGIFCYSEIALDGARLVFTGVQLVFMQTFRAATFNSSSGVKFVLYLTIVTNACIWINYVLDETDLLHQNKPHAKIGDAYVKRALGFCEVMTPFVLEYSLIVAGILHSISSQMTKPKGLRVATARTRVINGKTEDESVGTDETFVVIPDPNTTPPEAGPLADTIKSARSQPGFILGIFCGLVLVCSSLTFGTERTKFNKRSRDLFLLYEGILALVQTIIVFVILKLLQRHNQREHEARSEDALLIVGFIGIFIFQFIAMYSSIKCLTTDRFKCSEDSGTSSITIIQLLFIGVSNILQTIVFILSRRYTPDFRKERRSTGKIRQCILFLLTTNLSFWALDSFIELKDKATSSYPGGIELFAEAQWSTIVAFTFPVAIFFRFHCAAMLYEFWRRFSPENKPEEKLYAPTEDPANQKA